MVKSTWELKKELPISIEPRTKVRFRIPGIMACRWEKVTSNPRDRKIFHIICASSLLFPSTLSMTGAVLGFNANTLSFPTSSLSLSIIERERSRNID